MRTQTFKNRMTQLMTGIIVSTFLLSAALPSPARANPDVTDSDPGQPQYVKVSRTGNNVKFQLCNKQTSECENLGPKEEYSVSELSAVRTGEKGKFAGTIAGYVIAVAAGGVVVGFAGASIAGATFAAGIGGEGLAVVAGTGLGTGVAGMVATHFVIEKYFRAINPFARYKDMKVLSDDLVDGKNFQEANIEEFAHELEYVLNTCK